MRAGTAQVAATNPVLRLNWASNQAVSPAALYTVLKKVSVRSSVRLRSVQLLAFLYSLAWAHEAWVQWVTESCDLKPGWNAVWLPLNVSHAADILSPAHGDIKEFWRWNAIEAGHFTDRPAGPPTQTQLGKGNLAMIVLKRRDEKD